MLKFVCSLFASSVLLLMQEFGFCEAVQAATQAISTCFIEC